MSGLAAIAARLGMRVSERWDGTPDEQAAYAARHASRAMLADETDVQIASRVRMLMRDDLDHEAVVTIARDRICALAVEKAALLAQLERVTDHLAEWRRDHSMESVPETDAAIFCAREAITKARGTAQ